MEIKFEHSKLSATVIHPSRLPQGNTIVIGDYATSANPKSDYSGFVAGRIAPVNGSTHLYLIDGAIDRWESRELPYQAIKFVRQNPAGTIFLERLGLSQLLEDAIQAEAKRQGVNLGISWIQISNKKSAKDFRVSEFQKLCDAGRVHFVANDFINEAFEQLTKYCGGPRNKNRKDEYPDIFGYFALLMSGQL